MNILYISQYFAPEVGAPSNRALANAKIFQKKGHQITVLCEMPNHPMGIILDGYKHKLFLKEKVEGLDVHRLWVYTSKKKNFFSRICMYLSFSILGSFYTLLKWKKYDVVYVTSPPLFVGIIGLIAKFFHSRTKFVFEIRDLWPDVAIEMGQLNNGLLRKLSFRLEKKIYKKADKIISVTNNFKEKIRKKNVGEHKIIVVRNGANLTLKKAEHISENTKSFFRQDYFNVIYAGNVGLAQNVNTLIKSAELLIDKKVNFVIVGNGPEKEMLEKYVKANKISNVKFVGEVPVAEVSQYLSMADCGIIPLKNIPVFKSTIPSKIFDYMAVELPILLGVSGESKDIVNKSKSGICFEPDDHVDLKEKIMFLKDHPSELKKMRSVSRDFVEQNYDRNKLAAQIEKSLVKLVEGK